MSTIAASSQSASTGMMGLFNASHKVAKSPQKAKKSSKSNVIIIGQEGPSLLANTSKIQELTPDAGTYHVIEWMSHKMSGFGMAIVKDEMESNLVLYVPSGGKLLRIVPNEVHDDLDKNAPLFVKVLGKYTAEPSQLSQVVAAVENLGSFHDTTGRLSNAANCTLISYSTDVMKKIKQPTIIVKGLKGVNMVPRKGVYMCRWRTTNLDGYGLFCSIPRKSCGEILLYKHNAEEDVWQMLQPGHAEFKMNMKIQVALMMEYRKVKLLDEKQLVAQLQEDDQNLRLFIQNLRDDYTD